MPYIAMRENNVYLGEHNCKRYHYGDQTLVRACCVADAKRWKESTLRNALTREHPDYKMFCAAWNALTDAEMLLVGDIIAVYDHGPAGFKPHPGRQLELTLD